MHYVCVSMLAGQVGQRAKGLRWQYVRHAEANADARNVMGEARSVVLLPTCVRYAEEPKCVRRATEPGRNRTGPSPPSGCDRQRRAHPRFPLAEVGIVRCSVKMRSRSTVCPWSSCGGNRASHLTSRRPPDSSLDGRLPHRIQPSSQGGYLCQTRMRSLRYGGCRS